MLIKLQYNDSVQEETTHYCYHASIHSLRISTTVVFHWESIMI